MTCGKVEAATAFAEERAREEFEFISWAK